MLAASVSAGKGLLERERELAALGELLANVKSDGRGALVLQARVEVREEKRGGS